MLALVLSVSGVDDVEKVLRSMGEGHALHYHFEHYFEQLDTDKSGTVSFAELSRQAHKAHLGKAFTEEKFMESSWTIPYPPIVTTTHKSFTAMDTDSDGQLTRDELLQPDKMDPETAHLILEHHWEFDSPHPEAFNIDYDKDEV